jgi:hypothetical protein
VIEGICPKCGLYRRGWALCFPRHQVCPDCGTALTITENGRPYSEGYSPFDAEEYNIYPGKNAPVTDDKQVSQN